MASDANRSIYIGAIVGLSIAIFILFIALPISKKKYKNSTNTNTGNGNVDSGNPIFAPEPNEFGVVVKPLSDFIAHNKVVTFRSLGNGQTYKNNIGNYQFNLGNDTSYVAQANSDLFAITGGIYSVFNSTSTQGLSPCYLKEIEDYSASGYINNNLDSIILQKYNVTPKPSGLPVAIYDEMIKDGWYLIPVRSIFSIPLIIMHGKPYVVGGDLLYVNVVRLNIPIPNFNFDDFIWNTDQTLQAAIDLSFSYRNIFSFKRSFSKDNAFIIENIVSPGTSFEIKRHSFIRLELGMSTSDVDGSGNYRNAFNSTNYVGNTSTVALPASNYTDKLGVSFYIEDSDYVPIT